MRLFLVKHEILQQNLKGSANTASNFLLYLQFEGNLFCRLPLIAYFDFDGFGSGSYFEEANVFQILSKSWKNACE